MRFFVLVNLLYVLQEGGSSILKAKLMTLNLNLNLKLRPILWSTLISLFHQRGMSDFSPMLVNVKQRHKEIGFYSKCFYDIELSYISPNSFSSKIDFVILAFLVIYHSYYFLFNETFWLFLEVFFITLYSFDK